MNPESDDPIIDVLLEETLGGITPPDLSARILQSWSERRRSLLSGGTLLNNTAPPLNVFAGVDEPLSLLDTLAPPIVVGSVVRTAYDPVAKAAGTVRTTPRARRPSVWSSVQTWASVAAAMAVIALGYAGMRMSDKSREIAQPDPAKANSPEKIAIKPRSKKPETNTSPTPLPSPQIVLNTTPPVVAPDKSPNKTLPPRDTGASDTQVVSFINEKLHASWTEHGVQPATVATDAEWCRRTFLRIIGRIPTVDELQAFADDKSADKQAKLVDRLLGDSPGAENSYADEFARHWSEVLANILIGRGLGNDPDEPASRAGLQAYLQASLRQNKSYDRMALELISATGAGQPGADNFNGAANFLLAHAGDDATVATARTAKVFLGVQLQCVQCHDHPTAPLKQHSFWAMNAFFRQMKVTGNRNDSRELIDHDYLGYDGQDEEGRVFYELANGIVKVAEPTFIDGTTLPKHSGRVSDGNRREELAKLVVQSKYFGQATINRLWSHFLGFGFTRPVDDPLGATASHPEILQRVSEEFAANGYDLKRAMRWIALSDAFNRSSQVSASQLADMPEAGTEALFSHYYTRQLQAEEVFGSLQIAARLRRQTGASGNIEQARVNWLAQARKIGGDEEGVASPPVALSPIVKHATTPAQDGLLQSVLNNGKLSFEKKVEHLFLAALSRKPSKAELDLARSLGGRSEKNEAAALEDIWWALLNSSEFILDH